MHKMNDDEYHWNLKLRLFDPNTCNDNHVTNSISMLIVCRQRRGGTIVLSDEKLWYKDASTMTRFERENRAGTTGVVARRTEYLRIARHQFRNIHLSHSTLTLKKYMYM